MPKVSIIMPVYNAEKYIDDAIGSILGQSFQDFEIIATDDGSSDNSRFLLEKYHNVDSRVKVFLNEQNEGAAFTRNRCLEECTGEYIALLDADDVAMSDRLQKQVDFLDNHLDIDGVFGNVNYLSEDGIVTRGERVQEQTPDEIKATMFFCDIICNSTAMLRHDFIVRNNIHYDNSFISCQDYLFYVECLIRGARFWMLDDIVLNYRVVSTGISAVTSRKMKKTRYYYHNEIHNKMIEAYNIKINKLERWVLLYNTGVPRPRYLIKVLQQPILFILVDKLKEQFSNQGFGECFIRQCDIFLQNRGVGILVQVFSKKEK